MIAEMDYLSREERLCELGLFSWRRFWVDLTVAFQYLKRAMRKMGTDFLDILL